MTVARLMTCLAATLVAFCVIATSASAQEPFVELLSFTEGATVTIDDEVVGTTPIMDPIPLTVGTHTIRVTRRGYLPWEETVEVEEGDELFLDADPFPYAGIVIITTVEPGAEVSIDGIRRGTTPFDEDVTLGLHTISVTRDQYEEWTTTENISAGQEYTFELQLMPLASMGTEVIVTETTPWYREWWFWSGVAVAVGAGVASAVLLTQEEEASDAEIIIQLP